MKTPPISRSNETSPPAHKAPAVARAASVLRLLAIQRSGLGVTEIARRIGLVPSTCLHVLRALVNEGFITFDTQKKTYRTGVGLFTLVRDVMASSEFPQAVQPILDQFAADYPVSAIAVELDRRDRMVVVAVSRTNNFVNLRVNIGTRFPAVAGATGRCLAASSNDDREQLHRRFDQIQWGKPLNFEDWYGDVLRARTEGAAVDHGNFVRGLSLVSSLLPVGLDRGVRGITLIGFEHHLTERTIRQLKDELVTASQTVAAKLN